MLKGTVITIVIADRLVTHLLAVHPFIGARLSIGALVYMDLFIKYLQSVSVIYLNYRR
jgi:hypothetical protein